MNGQSGSKPDSRLTFSKLTVFECLFQAKHHVSSSRHFSPPLNFTTVLLRIIPVLQLLKLRLRENEYLVNNRT